MTYLDRKAAELTTQAGVRRAFWDAHPQFARRGNWRQNDYATDVRVTWVDYVDSLARSGVITEALAFRVTL